MNDRNPFLTLHSVTHEVSLAVAELAIGEDIATVRARLHSASASLSEAYLQLSQYDDGEQSRLLIAGARTAAPAIGRRDHARARELLDLADAALKPTGEVQS